MNKKKVLLLAASAYYLGSLNLPREARRQMERQKAQGKSVGIQIFAGAFTVACLPIVYPVGVVIEMSGYGDQALQKLQESNATLKLRSDIRAYEREQQEKAER